VKTITKTKRDKEKQVEAAVAKVRDVEAKLKTMAEAAAKTDNKTAKEKTTKEMEIVKKSLEDAKKQKDALEKAKQETEQKLKEKLEALEKAHVESKKREESILIDATSQLPDFEQGREFFGMTTAAVLQKLEDQGIIDDAHSLTWAFDLFDIAVLEGIPFHEWNDWILERVLVTKKKKDEERLETLQREAMQKEMEARRAKDMQIQSLNKTKRLSNLGLPRASAKGVMFAPKTSVILGPARVGAGPGILRPAGAAAGGAAGAAAGSLKGGPNKEDCIVS